MTTIAYRDGFLAADSICTNGNLIFGTQEKVEACAGGWLASCGCCDDGEALREWIEDGAKKDVKPNLKENIEAIWVSPDGRVLHLERGCVFFTIEAPFFAIGAGAGVAIGAMAAGASAEEAVKIACRFTTNSMEPVTVRHTAPRMVSAA